MTPAPSDDPRAPYGTGSLPGAGSEHATRMARRFTLGDLRRAKAAGERLVMSTAYDFPSGRLVDEAGVDLVLVGDSAAMVVLGHESTNSITMEEMLLFTRATRRACTRALVIGDMPFMSFQPSDELAVTNAGRFVAEAGADAVKVEGGGVMIDRVRAITRAGVAVFGHLGLTPQSATLLGGYRAQARTHEQALALLRDAVALEQAGAVAIVLEAIPAEVAAVVAEAVSVPTIGIGAGAATDGQVLVYHDMLGLTPGRLPRFVKRYADLASDVVTAIGTYASEVRSGAFPGDEHTYAMPPDEVAAFRAGVDAVVGSDGS